VKDAEKISLAKIATEYEELVDWIDETLERLGWTATDTQFVAASTSTKVMMILNRIERTHEKTLSEFRTLLEEVLVDLPIDYFDRALALLKLEPELVPPRPYTADDAFRDSMSNARAMIDAAPRHKQAELYVAMMAAIARKQHAEAADRMSRKCDARTVESTRERPS
jgi:hypothetical protein